jgi:hypothetical protein
VSYEKREPTDEDSPPSQEQNVTNKECHEEERIGLAAGEHTWINETRAFNDIRARLEHPSMEEGATTINQNSLAWISC